MIIRKQVTIRMVATAKKRRDTNLTQGMGEICEVAERLLGCSEHRRSFSLLELETKVRNNGEGPDSGLLLVESGYTTSLTFKTLLRCYAKQTLTPRYNYHIRDGKL